MNLIIRTLLILSCLGLPLAAQGQDTDLFMTNPGVTTPAPNILIIVDNTANWSRADGGVSNFDWVQQALLQTVSGLKVCKDDDQANCDPDDYMFSIGLMMFSETGGGNGNPSGGYVRSAIRPMTTANKATFVSLINSLGENADKGNGAEFALAMHEGYLYYQGMDARAGHNKAKKDDDAFLSNPTYQSPSSDACISNYVIFISNGPPSSGENTTAGSLLASLGADTNVIQLNPSGSQSNWSDEYARFMTTKGINTFAIDVRPDTNGKGPGNTKLLESMAVQGNGKYYAAHALGDLNAALSMALDEMQAVNSVFAATALPVSVNVRGTFLNEVYMAVFRPDASAGPRWFGNLKLYQFIVNSNDELVLADANDQAALSASGFINNNVTSFWTQPSNYWAFDPRGEPKSASDAPDGPMVEKGGTAQMQRDQWLNRNLYTCTSGCTANSLLSATPFSDTNAQVSQAALGVADATERDLLIDWVHGADNTSTAERDATGVRPSLHGDVVHSRPAVVNYNRSGTDTDIAVFYGANDGVFRAIRGSKNQADSGKELWGFVAPEFFDKLKWLRDNDPIINVPSDPDDPANNKPYFMDGNVSVHVHDANNDGKIIAADGDKAWLFITMRRGGEFLYALDVTVPETPRFLWKRTPADTGFAELGQTWSEAKVTNVNVNGTVKPMLIMGAGYDADAQDRLPALAPTKGRGVLVIDAETGNLLWQAGPSPVGATHNVTVAGMTGNIAADITVIDRNRDGKADRLYAVDTSANVWRIDIADPNPANWAVHKLAELGGTGVDARKFLFPADVVYARDANGPYDAVLLGSGDREKPFDDTIVNDFYMLKDRMVGSDGSGQTTIVLADLYDSTDNLIQEGSDAEKAIGEAALLAARGWYVRMRP
ncbi:MAG TPA: PilC/PilY family type IV pilus protein, partial [Gammaproteobacteria bacterium]|nr:PilC/PilY family type IV pilus protein [Gammaproteobacteria bacterium]